MSLRQEVPFQGAAQKCDLPERQLCDVGLTEQTFSLGGARDFSDLRS